MGIEQYIPVLLNTHIPLYGAIAKPHLTIHNHPYASSDISLDRSVKFKLKVYNLEWKTNILLVWCWWNIPHHISSFLQDRPRRSSLAPLPHSVSAGCDTPATDTGHCHTVRWQVTAATCLGDSEKNTVTTSSVITTQ